MEYQRTQVVLGVCGLGSLVQELRSMPDSGCTGTHSSAEDTGYTLFFGGMVDGIGAKL
jgi:hypothetical protein